MRGFGLAAFICGAGVHIVLPFPPHDETPLHLPCVPTMARRHREYAMAGNFHPFTAVKVLYVPNEFSQSIALALQELVGKRATEVLPALE